MKLFKRELDTRRYIIVTYFLKAKTDVADAAWKLAIGQSVGNPNIRNRWETDELFENRSCIIMDDEHVLKKKIFSFVNIAFPVKNINFEEDGISQLLCQIMGGQLDIDIIEKCQVINIHFPEEIRANFKGPRFGISGIRKFTNVYGKPILGGIIKPKVGLSPDTLLNVVKEMVEGGVNFIKEDEIMSNPNCCPIKERVPLIMKYLKDKNVIYAVCINSDYPHIMHRVKKVYKSGGNAVHVNMWCGLGIYKSIRELNLPLFLFFQKSGDKILTNEKHDYHIRWNVICKLVALMGADFIHAGMWGGYSHDSEESLKETLKLLEEYNVMPSLSCGLHPGLVQAINRRFGVNYMANVGGAIHGHPWGTKSGVLAMRQAIDRNYGKEYYKSIEKWGLVK